MNSPLAEPQHIQNTIRQNVEAIQSRMNEAVERSTVATIPPRLVAVTKYAEPEWIEALLEIGWRDLGESRPQLLQQRAAQYDRWPDLRWHQIGQLQRNKVRPVLEANAIIHSVDRWRLLTRINDISGELGRKTPLLLQVNIAGESQKAGFDPAALLEECERLRAMDACDVLGFMTMAPYTEDESLIRSVFRGLRELRDRIREKLRNDFAFAELSMGMTGDFEIAIEEGTTMVRIGSGLYSGLERRSVEEG